MPYSRVVKTKGNSKSVQVCSYRYGKRLIVKHLGSDLNDEEIFALAFSEKIKTNIKTIF